MESKLTAIQKDVLAAFFARENHFFLSGCAALAGFYLGHRETNDVDLFTLTEALDDAVVLLREIARQFGPKLEPIRTSPDFRRLLMRRGEEALVIDVVRENTVQEYEEKNLVNGIRIDRPKKSLQISCARYYQGRKPGIWLMSALWRLPVTGSKTQFLGHWRKMQG